MAGDAMTLALARDNLIRALQQVELRDIPIWARPEDYEELADDVKAMAAAFDVFMHEVGQHASLNAHGIDEREFASQVSDILGDTAIAELRAAANRIEENKEWAA